MTEEHRLGPGALLRPTRGDDPWAKVRSDDTGTVVAGLLLQDHGDGKATISLGGIWPVTGEVLATNVLHQFGPLTAQEREERGEPPVARRERRPLSGWPLKTDAIW